MSSDYKILCISHDPAIVTGEDYMVWNRPEPALAAIRDHTGPAAAHPNCELLIGRYSYPLVAICCPGGQTRRYHCIHGSDRWIAADWLRLLALADDQAITRAGQNAPIDGCWSRERALLLRVELGLEQEPPGDRFSASRDPGATQ